jgi:hypothetical protein
MKEPASSSKRIELARKWSPEEEEKLRQVMNKIADDLTERAQLLRSFCREIDTGLVYNPVHFCDVNNCPYRKRLKLVLSQTIEELEKTKRSFKSKQLEALRKKLCRILTET